MAVSGRKTNPFESQVNKGSTEDYDHICDPCLSDGQHVQAHGYCVECQDYLCITCFRSHKKSRASKHHELLDKTADVPRHGTTSLPDTCTEKCHTHGKEIIKFFCTEHKALGCNDCIILDHRTCEIDYIPDKCVGLASSNAAKSILNELNCLLENVSDVQEVAKAKTRQVDQIHQTVEEDINKFQKDINDRIAELRSHIIGEVDRNRQVQKEKINEVLKSCEEVETNVRQVQIDIQTSIAEKREGQMFISIKKAEHLLESKDTKTAEATLQGIVSDSTFQRNKHIESVVHDQTALGELISTNERRKLLHERQHFLELEKLKLMNMEAKRELAKLEQKEKNKTGIYKRLADAMFND